MRQTSNSLITMVALVAGTVALARPAEAQRVSVSDSKAAIRVAASAAVPYMLHLQRVGAWTVVEQSATSSVVELRVRAAANARWRLDVNVESGAGEVHCETGDWFPADGTTGPRPVILLGAPTDPVEVVVRLRIYGTPAEVRAAQARVVMTPVATDQGAVSVSWMGSE